VTGEEKINWELRPQDALPFSEDDDELEVVTKFFREMDSNDDKKISRSELDAAMKKYESIDQKELLEALKTMMEKNKIEEVSLEDFFAVVKDLPRVKGQRVHWARSLGLDGMLAKLLALGDIFDGLSALKTMSDTDLSRHVDDVCSKFSKELPGLLKLKLKELKANDELSALEFKNTKFSMEGSFEGSFASLQDFYDGPEKKIGTPNPKVDEGMRREHCTRDNAREKYTTPNYNFEFTPFDEYHFVVEPEKVESYPHTPSDKSKWPENPKYKKLWKGEHGRDQKPLQEFMDKNIVKDVDLKKGEVVSLRLYTGPLYMLYNAVLRRYPKEVFDQLKFNNYETTIFCIISGVSKLSRATEVPSERRVYRGLGGMILPDVFWSNRKAVQEKQAEATSATAESDVHQREMVNFRGGVEWGLMSTTTDREVAMQYSGAKDKRGTVFEISVGRIDIGADLTWVSQYPGEREILFPPLTCLEVVGEPRVETGVVVFSLRANMNLKGLTLEQLIERRKLLHLAMLKNLHEELHVDAQALQAKKQEGSEAADTIQLKSDDVEKIKVCIKKDFEDLEKRHDKKNAIDFNDDKTFKDLITEAIDGKAMALEKMRIYLEALCEKRKEDHLAEIFSVNFMELKSKAAQLMLKTGIKNFPWKSVVEDNSPKIDLGDWDAAKVTQKEDIKHVVDALGGNTHINSIVLKNVELALKDGWNTMSINMSNNAVVKELPATVALLLRNCKYLTSLDLRFASC
jgi:hypothetical protein